MTAADVTIPRHVRRVLGPGTRTSRDEAHAQGTLHSGRDRPGTIRANLVGDLRFRVRSYVILKRLPIAPLILYFLQDKQIGSSPSKVRTFAKAALSSRSVRSFSFSARSRAAKDSPNFLRLRRRSSCACA